ncbi:DUF4073 domain-containing protein, partial [Brevibacillus sp. SYP-B805]|uniref:DUF4073 domain-containing protein n=1 Tax=Brevibacillus sp. SYP-B805 TaxID=1578199 RepID=UPI0013EDEB5F
PAGEVTTVDFTANAPAAPNVTADDENNVLVGADATMEYSTDGGQTWVAYDEQNVPTFEGNVTVQVRVAATQDTPAGEVTTVDFTANAPAAPNVTADDENNVLVGADATMEYSTDGGQTWVAYDEQNVPTFEGNVTVQVRVAATQDTPAGEVTAVDFTG